MQCALNKIEQNEFEKDLLFLKVISIILPGFIAVAVRYELLLDS